MQPSRIRRLLPSVSRAPAGPGIAPTVRPSSSANVAVISEPDFSVASTTTVISASAAMIRFRAGNIQRNGAAPHGISETTVPAERTSL
jgi:hypothetical protein